MRTISVVTDTLEIVCHEYGDTEGWPRVLGHGFPYDALAYAESAPRFTAAGARVIVPYLRGYGPTRFLSSATPRSGEQAALAADLLALLDALDIERAVLGGYDWGGRAACIVAALWPERVVALVSGSSYNVQRIACAGAPAPAAEEAARRYQCYFHAERGRRGLAENRRDIAHHLWRTWAPSWAFDDTTFERTAASFDNPDFVDVAIHSYRHRYGLVPGDPAVAHIETRLVAQPDIAVPAITIDGEVDGVDSGTADHARRFTGPHEHRVLADTGHNLPQERPREWADAVPATRALAGASVRTERTWMITRCRFGWERWSSPLPVASLHSSGTGRVRARGLTRPRRPGQRHRIGRVASRSRDRLPCTPRIIHSSRTPCD